MGLLTRHEGWPLALAEVVERAQEQPYRLGIWDCLRFTCACIEAMTGHDFWPRFEGYRSHRQALVTIARIAPTLGEAVSRVLDAAPIGLRAARRGDVALYRDADGQDHLGVVLGAHVAVLGPEGLHMVPLLDAGLVCAWRVG